ATGYAVERIAARCAHGHMTSQSGQAQDCRPAGRTAHWLRRRGGLYIAGFTKHGWQSEPHSPGKNVMCKRWDTLGLLVGAEDVVLVPQGCALPHARIEVQNRASLVSEVGIARKNPVLVAPRFDGIRIENPPHRAATDRCAQHGADPRSDVGQGLA